MTAMATMGRLVARLRRLWDEARTDAATHLDGYVGLRERLRRLGIADITGLTVLEVGCGDRAQLSLLLAGDGARVTAIDQLPVALGWRRAKMWVAVGRRDGIHPAVRLLVRDLVHTHRYWRELARLRQHRLPFRAIRLIEGDASALPFPDQSFDLVLSSAVWEHLRDVDGATREVNRVLRPHGIAAIQIALFPALQGGHHADWHSTARGLERDVRPWDHLRPGRRSFPLYLNEWREDRYRVLIAECLDVFDWEDGEMRGEDLLDGQIRAEVTGYTDRDLLLSSITAWARRREPRDQ